MSLCSHPYSYMSENPNSCVVHLLHRLRSAGEFPHEIGLFWSYPPEAVLGVICNRVCNHKCVGCWKVCGDEQAARNTFKKYEMCSIIYLRQWQQGKSVEQLTAPPWGRSSWRRASSSLCSPPARAAEREEHRPVSPISIGKADTIPEEQVVRNYAERVFIEPRLRHRPLEQQDAGSKNLPLFFGTGARISATYPGVRRTAAV